MAEKPNLVHVEIFGQSYAVHAGGDPGHVEKLAAFVNAEMQDVSRASGAVDSVRIAVLAALNIADECFELRRQSTEAADVARTEAARDLQTRAEALAQELDSVLVE